MTWGYFVQKVSRKTEEFLGPS